ncbi:hypothetical protein ACFXCZ_27270 [Streptomyces sp. NPDC059396]|uniref:hypothetical protein n=1 Tax=Streptomyces sp. NPDC059396 TaxID=3346819 RepID=UPI0036AC257E
MTDQIPHFDSWSAVPRDTYMTKTMLAKLDLPRRPGGPVRAMVTGQDFRGRKTDLDLYAVAESVPSPASSRQLTAARAGSGTDARTCTDCGARPEQPCTTYADGAALCGTCAHIRALRTAQRDAAESRAWAIDTAARLLADERLAVVHVDLTHRGTTSSGVKRSPSAARLVALDTAGQPLIDVTVRLVGPRSKGIPDSAIAPEDAADPIRTALAGRTLLLWAEGTAGELAGALQQPGQQPAIPTGYGVRNYLWSPAMHWRADIDLRTRRLRPCIPPGTADRLLHLLQRIAADAATAPKES